MNPATPDRNTATNHDINTAQPAPVQPAFVPQVPAMAMSPATPSPVSSGPWPGAFEAFGMAFAQIKKNPQPALVVIAVYIVLGVIDVMVGGGNQVAHNMTSIRSSSSSNFTTLGLLIFLLADPIYSLAIADRKIISLAEFFKIDVRRYFLTLGAVILLGILFFLGSIPILIPLIWLIPWYSFVVYLIVDKGSGIGAAFIQSKQLGQHHKGKVWGVIGTSILLSIFTFLLFFIPVLGIIAAGAVGQLVSLTSYGALAILYRWIEQNQAPTV